MSMIRRICGFPLKERKKEKCKVNVWTLVTVLFMTQACDQQPFTVSEVADDWHEPMMPHHVIRPSIARANRQLDPVSLINKRSK